MSQNEDTKIQQVEESSKTKSINAKGRMPPPNDTSSVDKPSDQLYSGVFIVPNRVRYWVDNKLNKNCYALYARELTICWGEDSRYWKWTKEKETSGEEIEVAEVLEVNRLDVKGSFRTIVLSQKTLYEVVFVVKLKKYATSVFPMNLNIDLKNYKGLQTVSKKAEASLENRRPEEWIEIPVGEFQMSPENVGEVKVTLDDLRFDGNCKSGLVVKCLIFRPKNK